MLSHMSVLIAAGLPLLEAQLDPSTRNANSYRSSISLLENLFFLIVRLHWIFFPKHGMNFLGFLIPIFPCQSMLTPGIHLSDIPGNVSKYWKNDTTIRQLIYILDYITSIYRSTWYNIILDKSDKTQCMMYQYKTWH